MVAGVLLVILGLVLWLLLAQPILGIIFLVVGVLLVAASRDRWSGGRYWY